MFGDSFFLATGQILHGDPFVDDHTVNDFMIPVEKIAISLNSIARQTLLRRRHHGLVIALSPTNRVTDAQARVADPCQMPFISSLGSSCRMHNEIPKFGPLRNAFSNPFSKEHLAPSVLAAKTAVKQQNSS
jgi:hypothetical protein